MDSVPHVLFSSIAHRVLGRGWGEIVGRAHPFLRRCFLCGRGELEVFRGETPAI